MSTTGCPPVRMRETRETSPGSLSPLEVHVSTAEYKWVQMSTGEYRWVQVSTCEYRHNFYLSEWQSTDDKIAPNKNRRQLLSIFVGCQSQTGPVRTGLLVPQIRNRFIWSLWVSIINDNETRIQRTRKNGTWYYQLLIFKKNQPPDLYLDMDCGTSLWYHRNI